MAEEGAATRTGGGLPGLPGLLANRAILTAIGIGGLVFVLIMLLVFGRGLLAGGSRGTGKPGNYTVIMSHLSPKEAAEVTSELKTNLKIPYKLLDNGETVAVPKEKADDARLGLASKGLPQGGVVGFEIFDKGGLGTTDFDRRIKFVRAISGELSRNISRLAGVEEARVQIVMPETQVFMPQRAPVTASVLLRLRSGLSLNQDQVEGIIRLVCGSVENLKPENVTVVDINGYILSQPKTIAKAIAAQKQTEQMAAIEAAGEASSLATKETPQETIVKVEKTAPLGEQAFDQLKYKEELETNLREKAQAVLDSYYLPNKARVWVNADLVQPEAVKAPGPEAGAQQPMPWKLNKLSVVIMVDDQDPVAQEEKSFADLKKITFESVAGAIGYDAKRGDRIELKRVPIGEAAPAGQAVTTTAPTTGQVVPSGQAVVKKNLLSGLFKGLPWWSWLILGLVLVVLLAFFLARGRRKKAPEIDLRKKPIGRGPAAATGFSEQPAVQKMRQVAEENPEKFAEVLKDWFKEGAGEAKP